MFVYGHRTIQQFCVLFEGKEGPRSDFRTLFIFVGVYIKNGPFFKLLVWGSLYIK